MPECWIYSGMIHSLLFCSRFLLGKHIFRALQSAFSFSVSLCIFHLFFDCSILEWDTTFAMFLNEVFAWIQACQCGRLKIDVKIFTQSKLDILFKRLFFTVKCFENVIKFTNFIWFKSWNIIRWIRLGFSLTLESFPLSALSYTSIQHKHCNMLEFLKALYDTTHILCYIMCLVLILNWNQHFCCDFESDTWHTMHE